MKSPKKMLTILVIAAVLFIGSITMVAVVVNEVMTALIMSERKGNVTEEMLEGLPPFITVEMVEVLLEMQDEYGHPASTGLAQIIAESGFGYYGPGGEAGQGLSQLAYNQKNLFGIKWFSGDQYATGSYSYSTGEQTPDGGDYIIQAGFSVYRNYGDCIRQRAWMLERSPYASHVASYKKSGSGTYSQEKANNFIAGIRAAGWATSITYVEHCQSLMRTYNLYRFDNLTLESFENSQNGNGSVVGSGRFTHPCPGMTYQSSYFGEIREFEVGGHKGHDYAAPTGTPTLAADDGVVTIAGWSDSAGNWVVIDHGNGLVTKYMHHSRITVIQGQKVKKGQKIGEVGSTGQSTGPHLHFQVELYGVAVNPDNYLK